MKTKLFTLLLAVAAGIGTMFASNTKVDGIWYDFDSSTKTASVTYRGESYYAYVDEYSGSVVIPSTVTYNSVTYSVTSIGGSAFCGCTSLTSVEIGNSVTSIGGYAFYNCSGLTSVTIPNSVTSIGSYAFFYCSGLTSVEIGNSVTSIGNDAFRGCSGLTSVTIPNSVTSIGSGAFSDCTGLTSPVFNAHVFAFMPTSYYGAYTIPDGIESIAGAAFSFCTGLTSVTIGNSVTSIGSNVFYDCSGLTSVTIPNSVTSIGGYAFRGCTGLTSVTAPAILFNDAFDIFNLYELEMPSQIKQLTINGGELTEEGFDRIHASYRKLEAIDLSAAENTEISDEAFKGCYNLKTLKLPVELTQIGYMATAECVNLESIDIPASVEEIGDRAFEDCRSLQSITFGGSANPAPGRFNAPAAASQLKRIGNWAFYNAHELQHLDIPEGVTEIGDGAFYGCTYLEDLVLPSSVRAIGDNCFALCSKLTKIVVNSTTPPEIEAKTFYDVKRQIPVYVPDEAVSAYEADTYWQEFDIQGASKMPQDIDQVPSDQVQSTKFLHNGQIFILRGEKIYTVTGQGVK